MLKKQQETEGLDLGGGSNIFCEGQMGEEGFDFWNTHFLGMAFVVEKDEASNLL
jgi:hypothetical protein